METSSYDKSVVQMAMDKTTVDTNGMRVGCEWHTYIVETQCESAIEATALAYHGNVSYMLFVDAGSI
jgi:hypothetical protein